VGAERGGTLSGPNGHHRDVATTESFALDTNILDKIVDVPGALDLVKRLVSGRKIVLVVTHVQEDEVAQAPPARRARLNAVPREVVPTYGFVIGESRIGMARLSGEEPLDSVRGENWTKRTRDALIAVTADYDGHTLVTEDSNLRTRAKAVLAVTVWDWAAFHGHLEALGQVEDRAASPSPGAI